MSTTLKNYPINTEDETVFWGRTKKNYYWGIKCGGLRNEDAKCTPLVPGQFVFKIKKWRNGSNNSGPVGWKARRAKRGKI
jgi:hypothetical protein